LSFLWQAAELNDLNLAWDEFHQKHPNRTRKAWLSKRQIRRGGPARSPVSGEEAEKAKKIWALMTEMQALVTPDVPDEINVSIPETCISLSFLSDAHIGGVGVDYQQLLRDVDIIANTPGSFVYLGGDMVDSFILAKMISASREQLVQVDVQWKLFEDIIRRLDGKVVAVGAGNHDAWTYVTAGIDKVGEICSKWGTIYTGHGGLLNLTVGNQLYKIFRHHRFRFSSYLHPAHAVIRMWEIGKTDFQIGVIEHHHSPHIEQFFRHGEHKIAVRCGSYKVTDPYAKEHGFYGVLSLVPTVVLDGRSRKMTPFLDLNDAIAFLGTIR
jgi:hypothetical protein